MPQTFSEEMKPQMLAVLAVVMATSSSAEEKASKPLVDHHKVASDLATELKAHLADEWDVSSKESIVTLVSRFQVFQLHALSRPSPLPPLDAPEERLLKEARPSNYVIRLRVAAPLEKQKFLELRKERQEHADYLNFGGTKDGWYSAARKFKSLEVPRYRLGFYDVYRTTTDTPSTQIFPIAAIGQVGAAKELIDTIIRPMRAGTD